jgi:diguanylate cyclase (GGDEF)-like protein
MAVLVAAIAAAALVILWLAVLRPRRAGRGGAEPLALFAAGFPGVVLVFDRRLRHTAALGRGIEAMAIEPLGSSLHEVFPAEACLVIEPTYRAVFDGLESQIEVPLAGRDWLITVSPLGSTAGLLVATDVTERKRRERSLSELASRDLLTGAWNTRRLTQELDWLQRSGGTGSLLALDLDGFKRVNDTLGHAAGDELLRRVATAVQGCVRRADLVARIGGDEFAVFLAGATPAEAQQVAGKIRSAVGAVWPLGIPCGVSVGISAAGQGTGDALGRADRAMYADKRRPPLERLAS